MAIRVVVSHVHATQMLWLATSSRVGRCGPWVWGEWVWQGISISTPLQPVGIACGAAAVGEQI